MIRLYLLGAALLMGLVGGLYVQHLRSTVDAQNRQIATLKLEKAMIEEAGRVLEELNERTISDFKSSTQIKENIRRAPEASVPEPISRALDGLRQRGR